MGILNWFAGVPSTSDDPLGAEVHNWLELRKKKRTAITATHEKMCELMTDDYDTIPGEVLALEEAEDRLDREIQRSEIKIDRMLV